MKMKLKTRRQSRKSFHRFPKISRNTAHYIEQFCRINYLVWEAA